MALPGTLARFSAQSVSITPVCGFSFLMTKPFSCQKALVTFQALSSGTVTTSQRWLPWRSILATPRAPSGNTVSSVLCFWAALFLALICENTAVPVVATLGAEYWPELLGRVRSGGISRGGALAAVP